MKFLFFREAISRTLLIVTLCGPVTVSACAGREPHPIATTNATDSQFDCAGITREFEANERSIIAISKERSSANAKNIAWGVTGVTLFAPAIFLMDPKSPERVEIEALRNRNHVLLPEQKVVLSRNRNSMNITRSSNQFRRMPAETDRSHMQSGFDRTA